MFDLGLAYTQRLARALHEMSGDGFTCADENHTNRAQLGRVETITPSTGATMTCSAQVFFLYDADGNVLWRALGGR